MGLIQAIIRTYRDGTVKRWDFIDDSTVKKTVISPQPEVIPVNAAGRSNPSGTEIYYIDAARISFKYEVRLLERTLDMGKLKEYAESVNVLYASSAARQFGYKAVLRATGIHNKKFFKLLDQYVSTLFCSDRNSSTSYLEITKDTIGESNEATIDAFEYYAENMWRPRAFNMFIFDSRGDKKAKQPTDSKYSPRTLYTKVKHCELAMYPHKSKVTREPCLHIEFRLKRQAIVARFGKLSISDLYNLDLEQAYKMLDEKYIHFVKIDHEKHGKLLASLMFAEGIKIKPGTSLEDLSRDYCKKNGIRGSLALRRHYRKKYHDALHSPGRPSKRTEILRGLRVKVVQELFSPISKPRRNNNMLERIKGKISK